MKQATPTEGAAPTFEFDRQPELSEDDAADAFLKLLHPDEGADAKKPSAKKKDEAPKRDTPETDAAEEDPAEKPGTDAEEDDQEERQQETDEDEEGSEKTFADADDTYVKIKVGDEEKEVRVKDLTRLYGQEAALTKKSMEVAEQRKAYETKLQEQAVSANSLLERARERYKQYANLDFNMLAAQAASGQLDPEGYQNLRTAAYQAWQEVRFLEEGVVTYTQKLAEKRSEDMKQEAIEAIKVLTGPVEKGGIEGWSPERYKEIVSFAVEQGAPQDVVGQITQPWALRLLHDAMLFARGKQKSKGSEVKVTKVNKTPKRITKTTTSPSSSSDYNKSSDVKKAMAKLVRSGSTDDAAEAYLARWNVGSDD